jgi:hypothetical protein
MKMKENNNNEIINNGNGRKRKSNGVNGSQLKLKALSRKLMALWR